MMTLRHWETTREVIGAYYGVYNGTGRTYPESLYEQAMVIDITARGVSCLRQPAYQVFYKGVLVGKQVLDLFVAEQVCVEIKVATELTRLHKAQGISYLKVIGREDGLLCNFGGPKPEFERLFFNRREPVVYPGETAVAALCGESGEGELLWPELTHVIIGGLFEVHNHLGPGFIHRIYANAVYCELQLRRLRVKAYRQYEVFYKGECIGEINFNHLLVDERLMVFPVAIQNMADISINNLKAWMQQRKIRMGILANFYATRLGFLVLRV
jgi:GxxExxY protein